VRDVRCVSCPRLCDAPASCFEPRASSLEPPPGQLEPRASHLVTVSWSRSDADKVDAVRSDVCLPATRLIRSPPPRALPPCVLVCVRVLSTPIPGFRRVRGVIEV
jgi:hypothetical protein